MAHHKPATSDNLSASASLESQKEEMFGAFQSWAIKNYGDSGKTKTVTRKKYERIVRTLTGEEQSSAENSKFRFWVKAKGFRLGPLESSRHGGGAPRRILYVPSRNSEGPGCSEEERSYKRVAIVEEFFHIIYNVHVEMDGRGGKHAGQKRTYRAIAETYSFLPREAVTRFLMSCTDCQKRMHLSLEGNNNTAAAANQNESPSLPAEPACHVTDDPPIIDFSVPITQTYLNHMRNKGYMSDYSCHEEESLSSADSDMSTETSPSTNMDSATHSIDGKDSVFGDQQSSTPINMAATTQPPEVPDGACALSPRNATTPNKSPTPDKVVESKGHPERKRRASNESEDSAITKTSEGGAADDVANSKDEDDDDNDDDDEKGPPGHNYDPERLKAFNMFVRLFVDENLDRSVPISKQPKDKIQAILEACDRQFPEFHERSRKRIRTYLKSCRRMRRSKEQNGWEPHLRPTPPHLTSAAAEGLLAAACENESQNAKRMRMGLEPLPASVMNAARELGGAAATLLPVPPSSTASTATTPQQQQQQQQQAAPTSGSQTQSLLERPSSIATGAPATDFLRHQPPPPAAFRAAPEFHAPFFANGNGLFRPGFAAYQHPAHHHPAPAVLQHPPLSGTAVTNGDFVPTDLSMKKSNSKNQLSAAEVTTIKQLIAGYRESAAFLYRSADELEQLLLQQN